ncbi:helix-turn-helix domain-containing protein [Gordonia sp. VNQ95]|jgi:hypothetical protein|uniref:helix-turn-helix domain-containing protein n=1 Tax=Gordonia TaxID=2053 RepID=UPI0032B3BEAD
MDVVELASVADVARQTGLSERRVRALIAAGQLPAQRVLGRWAVSTDDLGRFRRSPAGRPLSELSDWAILGHLAGDTRVPRVAVPSRVRSRVRQLAESAAPETILVPWMRTRSTPQRYSAADADVVALGADDRVIIGGHHALADDTVADLQVYAQGPDVDDLRRDYHLLDEASDSHAAGQAAVTIRVVSDLDLVPRSPLSRHKVAAPVAAVDVLDTSPPGIQARPALQLLRAAIGAVAAARPVKQPPPVRDAVVRRPHPVAESLDELRGPTSGSVRLPVAVDWGPAREYDIDDPQDAVRLYSQVLREASTAQELVEYLNGPLLTRLWLSLNLPAGIVQQWEDRFPELAAHQ